MSSLSDLHVVIPAGGAGTRLWPLSRVGRPKFLLDLTGSGRTLLQETWDRLTALVHADHVHVVTGARHADAVRRQLPALTSVFVEPSARDSMPAIGLAAAVIAQREPDAVVASFAADHVISGADAFADAVRQAVRTARTGKVVTIGITPRTPSTAFGYIQGGAPLQVEAAPSALSVARFVEKPDEATAMAYLADGSFTWNAGMFVTRADTLLGHLESLQPHLHTGLRQIAAAWDGPQRDAVLQEVWPTLTPIAIDHAVAEPVSLTGGMAMVPGTFEWDDVGDFAALHGLATDASGTVLDAETIWLEADGLARTTDGTTVAVLGISDAVVVRTEDALLVTTLEHAQRVKEIPAVLRASGRENLT